MRILICASGNSFSVSPFVHEQVGSLKKLNIQIDYFFIKGKGLIGYIKNYPLLIKKIKTGKYDLVHAHYGLSGLLASLQRLTRVIITFHGSDINMKKNFPFSMLASRLSHKNIFVHQSLPKKLKLYRNNFFIIPCGINLDIFSPMDKLEARNQLGWEKGKIYILFSSQFDNPVKNVSLAKLAIENLGLEIEFIELRGYSKQNVCLLMNAVDLLLVTSFSETGPIVVKEALACNCPIVSTDVGDVKSIIGKIDNCFITSYNPVEICQKIKMILDSNLRSNGRRFISQYNLDNIAEKINKVYKNI